MSCRFYDTEIECQEDSFDFTDCEWVFDDNYPEDSTEELDAVNNPEDAAMGTRMAPFSRVLYIERDDFHENPPKKFFRLAPGREVRLRYGYFIRCTGVVKDPATGEVSEVHCTYDPETKSGFAPDRRKVEATLHWVSAAHALSAEVRLYDRLYRVADPLAEGSDHTEHLNPKSLETLHSCRLEPSLVHAAPGDRFQFERLGYFCVDTADSKGQRLVFNRAVTLRDAWTKLTEKGEKKIVDFIK